MININNYISGHHPGLRAKVLVSQAIWSPPEQKVKNKCCVYDQYQLLHFRTSHWPQGQVPGEPGHLEPPEPSQSKKLQIKVVWMINTYWPKWQVHPKLTGPLLDKYPPVSNCYTLGHQYWFPYIVMISVKITNYLNLIWYWSNGSRSER